MTARGGREGRDQIEPLCLGQVGADQRRAGDILFALGKGCDQPWGAQPQRGIAQ